jgi:protein involved in polysaccharide export with SLBB domain
MNQKTETLILNWYEKNCWVRDLRKLFSRKREMEELGETFVTMRLGSKWTDRLKPGDKVAISVSNDPNNANVIGYAGVISVKKVSLLHLSKNDLKKNIGSKSKDSVHKDMEKIYKRAIPWDETVSVLELVAV